MRVLLTGGLGFIGSHTAVELLVAGHEVVIVDDLSNSKPEVLSAIEEISGKSAFFYKGDVADRAFLTDVFAKEKVEAVIHFAGYKAVGESVAQPLKYYRNNLGTTLTLLEIMAHYGVTKLIFSSSATVYGVGNAVPFREDSEQLGATNPYGWTKFMIEQMLKDAAIADKELSVVLLRYFNPIGAHPSGLIGEAPNGIPNNLMPYITQVAVGKLKELSIYGNDYPTPDGTGVRDYIHVVDLAKGHVAALNYATQHLGAEVFNLGTGVGYSVLDIVHAFQKANGVKVPYKIAARRSGDIATCYADVTKARNILGWQAEYDITAMCRDAWHWQRHCQGI